MSRLKRWIARLGRLARHARDWIRDHVPPGLRTLLGLLLIAGGIFGVLPVLAFWWIPAGIMVIALDIRALRRWWRHRREARKDRDDEKPAGG